MVLKRMQNEECRMKKEKKTLYRNRVMLHFILHSSFANRQLSCTELSCVLFLHSTFFILHS
jgi:hypothetical protein